MPPCAPEGSCISLVLSMPCTLILLALADAVGYRVQVSPHHVQFVGPELLALLGPEDVLIAVVELDDDLADPVRVYAARRHVKRAAPPLPVSSLQGYAPLSVLALAPRRMLPTS